MIVVVVDTNVFVRETHLLRKKGGLALVHLLRAAKGQLLIPEILHREYVEQTVRAANEQRSKVGAAFNTLETLLGVRFDHLVLDDEAVRLRVVERLRSIEALTLSDPLTSDLHVAAGVRSLENRRPASKTDHGYKDCLIWESVLRLPHGCEVRFVSRDDKAFFEENAFHPGLIAEARMRGINVVGYRDIERVVDELREAIPSLDLATLEAHDLAEQAVEPTEDVVPSAPTPRVGEAADGLQPPAGDVAEVVRHVCEAQKRFDGLDVKVLAYIAYFDSASKADLFSALADAHVSSEVVRNVAERLALTGLVRDTGNH